MSSTHRRCGSSPTVRDSTFQVFVVRCLGVASLFALEVTLGRTLGVPGYGTFAFIMAVATVVAHFSPLGWLNTITRLVRTYTSENSPSFLKGSLIAAHGATASGLIVAGLTLLPIAALNGDGDHAIRLKLGLSLGVGLAIVELHRYILRGQHGSILGEALSMLLLPLGVLFAVWSVGLASIEAVVDAYIVVCGLILFLSTARIISRSPPEIFRVRADYRFRAWAGMAGAMLLGTASDDLSARAAILVLGATSTSEAAGLYQAATRLALITVFILRAVTAVAAPRMAELYHAGELAKVRSIYTRACIASAAGAAPFLLIFGLQPELLLGLFGQGFKEAAPLLQILTIGYFVSAVTGPCATGLMMIGREKIYGALAALGAGLILAGLLIFVPHFHALGAAAVTATVIALVNLCYAAVMLHATRTCHRGPRAAHPSPKRISPAEPFA